MKYTVFESKTTGARFFSSYTERDETGWHNIVGHCNAIEDAQAMCGLTKNANIEAFINDSCAALPPELKELTRKMLQ